MPFISKEREKSFDKAVSDLIPLMNSINIQYISKEDHQSMMDLQDGIDIEFLKDGQWHTASSRISSNCDSTYISMRYKRKSGAKTEYEKRVEYRKLGLKNPEYMFHWHVKNNFTTIYICKTDVFLDFCLDEDTYVLAYEKKLDNASFINIPVSELEEVEFIKLWKDRVGNWIIYDNGTYKKGAIQ